LTLIAINTFKFLIILFLFIVFLQFTTIKPSLTWVLLPIPLLVQLLLITAITSLFAAVMPFFPDFRFILDNVLMMMLFLSGIFFNIANMPATIQKYFYLNPMAVLIMMYREIIIDGVPPNWLHLFFIMVFALAVLLLAIWLLYRFDKVYPKIIY
jgi:lipopolysaccharide transport system permease protein